MKQTKQNQNRTCLRASPNINWVNHDLRGNVTMPARSGIIFVGNKTPMDYVLAIITGLSASDATEITLKARGQSITTAVDASEITRRRFLKDLRISKIAIGTEEMPPRRARNRTLEKPRL